ncbi:MAG TPA: PCP reductase family protein [Mariprofundaceae bacterium]|nr:PCP reductase family protein [Mariprofundaceae bacterium]
MSNESLPWDDEALARMGKIPSFVRNMARAKIEKAALEAGENRVTSAFMDAKKARLMG